MAKLDKRTLFATPVFVFEPDGTHDLNVELARRMLIERDETPGVARSNVGGWHSTPDLAQRDDACYQRLVQLLVDHVSVAITMLAEEAHLPPVDELRYVVHAWAMVMRDGDYTTLHDHGDAHWSVVYYVDAGDVDVVGHPESGVLSLVDPRRGGRAMPGIDLFPTRFDVHARTGTLVVYPAWLSHYVHPYRGGRPRISISANLVRRVEPLA